MNVGDGGRCLGLGDEKLALCRRCCVVQGLTHPEATAARGQKRMSHCLTRPVEVWWHEQILQDLLFHDVRSGSRGTSLLPLLLGVGQNLRKDRTCEGRIR